MHPDACKNQDFADPSEKIFIWCTFQFLITYNYLIKYNEENEGGFNFQSSQRFIVYAFIFIQVIVCFINSFIVVANGDSYIYQLITTYLYTAIYLAVICKFDDDI